jgi:hypothetical protein
MNIRTRGNEFASRTFLFVLVFALAGLVLLLNSLHSGRSADLAAMSPAPMVAFSGGTFEASGVTHVPGTAAVLFVDDGRPDEIFWMQLGEDRVQSGPIKSVELGASVIDLEGITTDGSNFYVVGSQSKSKGGDLAGLVRFKFDPASQRVEGVESVSGLKKFLADNVAELRGIGDRKYKDGGINVEGIAWDPKGGRLLLGLRSPVIEGHALVVPLRLRDPQGAFSQDNLEVEETKAIRLPLAEAGIRSIEYDERQKAFRIITGAAANNEKADFKLWEWDGNVSRPTLRATETFDRKLKPEEITRFSASGRDFTFIVFDTSGYAAMD